ncbi:hypothetical protein M422DRAFT_38055 [Sphaerobolus stellatus SS14]|uniref:Unplaced genomic scaffold SPHSTscaffold_277, whole genome shotgun sequence n=1 Tax=Sphaerobolus stellatus (strain SS14) TaxID=990650 RepID=A0A0C9TCP8_SPHS4|nr:hypothetical protein M422DRAFT_38055 [Sphaerobolus stellatus SS14]
MNPKIVMHRRVTAQSYSGKQWENGRKRCMLGTGRELDFEAEWNARGETIEICYILNQMLIL